MAKKVNRPQNTGTVGTKSFDKDLIEDVQDYHLPPNSWTHARNAINNSTVGDFGDIGNEPSNEMCAAAPYKIIGIIHLEADRWVVFSTDETNSEIGEFQEDVCSYTTIVNDPCLNFSDHYLVKGVSKENFDCTWQVYWDDGNNPTRTMNIDDVPLIQICEDENGVILPGPPGYEPVGCITCTDTRNLDCDRIRLAPLITPGCFTVSQGASGGTLLNGSYYVSGAYVVDGQVVTDYFPPSNVQGIFSHDNVSGSLDITVDQMDEDFDEFQLVIVSTINEQLSIRIAGLYSTRQKRISFDRIDDRWVSIEPGNLVRRNPIADKSDAIYENADYMLRVGPTDKFDFNYQPLANQITANWVSVEYPKDYYRKGGNQTGYMRDEVYAFFIRWVYNTGDKSPSFHIPGRYETPFDTATVGSPDAQIEIDDSLVPFRWRVYNTASVTSLATSTLPDGGVRIASGEMAYWESSEKYDDDTPLVWNASTNTIWGSTDPAHDLCGKQIRHHKFPDNGTDSAGNPDITYTPTGNFVTNHYSPGGDKIRIMGVEFDNIKPPLDNQGNVIQNVVSYEILRGTREGNKSIVAKGMINNMREYDIEGGITTRQGLYPNYPYNDLNPDLFISTTETTTSCPYTDRNPNPNFSLDNLTFHSPETSFRSPFLSAKELKLYGEFSGDAEGQFVVPDKHPEHKLVTDLAFFVSLVAGIGFAMLKVNGERRTHTHGPKLNNIGLAGALFGTPPTSSFGQISAVGTPGIGTTFPQAATSAFALGAYYGGAATAEFAAFDGGAVLLGNAFAGTSNSAYYDSLLTSSFGLGAVGGFTPGYRTYEQENSLFYDLPLPIRILQGAPTFNYYMSQGADETLRLFRAVSKYRQYALQYQSHCFYDQYAGPSLSNIRRSINEAIYVDPQIQDFGANHRISNVFRSRTVAVQTGGAPLAAPVGDNTRQTVTSASGPTVLNPDEPFTTTAKSHYAGLKQRIVNQYGQIEGIIQVPVSTCPTEKAQTTSDVMFNGDIYIGRYTEKNTMFFFYDWLFDQPNGAEFNYKLRKMLPHPIYWMDTTEYDMNEFVNGILSNLLNPALWPSFLPSGRRVLDKPCLSFVTGIFVIKNAYMYLFNSGVRDFFVESEINIEYRDWGDGDTERHYDPYGYTDLQTIFNTSIIKAGNFWKYDYSLSVSRLFNNFISWGNTHTRDYDPETAESCFVYRPNRVIYSLPQHMEQKKDFWRVFLPNNYRDFKSRVTAIKPVSKNGALILFENESPVQFLGVDQLQTDGGTKLTIGDGGLFSQPMQALLNTDRPYEYGSCQDRLSVVNTASGVFWMSQNQGKIFQLLKGVREISNTDLKWWLSKHLPYKLTEVFPDFELTDNPVAGIGCQAIYDNRNQIVYFCKKDYVVRDDIPDTVVYTGSGNDFLVNNVLPVKLGDPAYFRDASWTVSYDPKTEGWIAYHDWHPNLLMPGKETFLSIIDEGIWVHNDRCDSYCNFYGVDYPFEVEYAVHTIQEVNTLRSVEYQMEVYKYDDNCFDRFHVLDFNFDEAVIYNSEQCSGLLHLNLSPKNNAPQIVTYPQIAATFIGILYSKEEQRYRFNQFWDITADRGEFNPTAERVIWNTEPNGYIRNLNPNNLNYNKFETQRKKFRHYKNTVLLRRRVSGNRKMLVTLVNNKNLSSPR